MKLLVYEHAKIDIEEGDFKQNFKLGLILNINLYVYIFVCFLLLLFAINLYLLLLLIQYIKSCIQHNEQSDN